MSLSRSIKTTDSVYSKYIRLKYADKNGYVSCITCGARKHYKEMDCGHYVSRGNKSLRFDDRNAFPQCIACNRFHEGVKDEFALFLINRFGKNILKDLNRDKNKIKKWTQSELKELRKELRNKIKIWTATKTK